MIALRVDSWRIALLVPPQFRSDDKVTMVLAQLLDPPPPRGPFEIVTLVSPAVLSGIAGTNNLFAVDQKLQWIRGK